MGVWIGSYPVTESWTNLVTTNPALANVDLILHASDWLYVTETAANVAPASTDAGTPMRAREEIYVNAPNIWVRHSGYPTFIRARGI